MNENLDNQPTEQTKNEPNFEEKGKKWSLLLVLVITILLIWFFVKPGVFTIQPIGVLPDGITFIYHSRGPNLPFYSSPDGMCIQSQGSVTLLCRAAAMSASTELLDRKIIKFPYSHWAYLRSTGGIEFDR